MKIQSVKIRNFRRLIDIDFDCKKTINTIVGPNGVGKSSVLDAIRIVKSILAPTFESEAQQTLQNMGIFSPFVNGIMFETVCNNMSNEIIIHLKIELDDKEIIKIKARLSDFVMLRLQNRMAQRPSNQLNLIAFLSTPVGQHQLNETTEETTRLLAEFEKHKIANLKLIINPFQMKGENGFNQELVTFLFRNSIISETLFSVFPPDRSFPTGEIQVQLGHNDISQQTQSYSIQPHLKFHRLKTAIITYLMMNDNNIQSIQEDFKLIFDNLIPGKELAGIKLEQRTGRLSVMIKEISTNALYDIDFLSSGEKGLLLTLFLLKRTMAEGGIVLIDEPELHLNPAVNKNIVPFLKDYITIPKDVQIILTTHSAEILASTKEDESCNLLHLINEKTISPIYKKDNTEAQDAIRCLGISTSDLLFNKGVIYLEGTTDENFINELFKGVIVGFKIQPLGGRNALEAEVEILQTSDKKGELDGYHVFILDLDNKPTNLKDSANVKIIQWDRYSFENYLLNLDTLYDVIRDLNPKNFPSSRAEFNRIIKEIAYSQIQQFAVKDIYDVLVPQSISISKKEIIKDVTEVSLIISDKLESQNKNFYENFDKGEWEKSFSLKVEARKKEIEGEWEETWRSKCKGKDLLIDIYNKFELRNFNDFVIRLINAIKNGSTEEWDIIKSKVDPIIKKN